MLMNLLVMENFIVIFMVSALVKVSDVQAIEKALNDKKGPNPGNSPGVEASLLRGKLPSLFVFYFRLADAQRLSRLRRARSAFSRLRRSLRKQTARSLLSAPYWKP